MEYNQGKNKVVFSFDSNLTKEVHAFVATYLVLELKLI